MEDIVLEWFVFAGMVCMVGLIDEWEDVTEVISLKHWIAMDKCLKEKVASLLSSDIWARRWMRWMNGEDHLGLLVSELQRPGAQRSR